MIENNNRETNFIQVWPDYVYTEVVPEQCPELLSKAETFNNRDGTIYTIHKVSKVNDANNDSKDFLMKVSNLLLVREFRQGNIYKFEDEEMIRRIILPGQTTYRDYQPIFRIDNTNVEYTVLDPNYDLSNCRIKLNTDAEKVYIDCWFYIGETLADIFKPPFSDDTYILINLDTNAKVKLKLLETVNKEYFLPKTDMKGEVKEDATFVTQETINTVLNEIGKIDGGVYW